MNVFQYLAAISGSVVLLLCGNKICKIFDCPVLKYVIRGIMEGTGK